MQADVVHPRCLWKLVPALLARSGQVSSSTVSLMFRNKVPPVIFQSRQSCFHGGSPGVLGGKAERISIHVLLFKNMLPGISLMLLPTCQLDRDYSPSCQVRRALASCACQNCPEAQSEWAFLLEVLVPCVFLMETKAWSQVQSFEVMCGCCRSGASSIHCSPAYCARDPKKSCLQWIFLSLQWPGFGIPDDTVDSTIVRCWVSKALPRKLTCSSDWLPHGDPAALGDWEILLTAGLPASPEKMVRPWYHDCTP